MSSTLPPDGPPAGPEQLSPEPAPSGSSGSGRRRLVIGGAVVAVAGLVGGGAWAATSFFGTGAQPSEAVPASALGYVSLDLDPDGAQKIEAVRMLRQFPAFREQVGIESGDDVREKVFEALLEDAQCDLDYADDVEPWIGERVAAAVLPGEEPTEPVPFVVLQVSDAGAAEEGLAALAACGSEDGDGSGDGGGGEGGFAVEGDWAVVAETEEIAQGVLDDAAEASLADDEEFGRWAEEVGDPGVLSAYAAPEAGAALLAAVEAEAAEGGSGDSDLGAPPFPGLLGGMTGFGTGELPEASRRQLEEFGGAAATLRFEDGGLELAFAADGAEQAAQARPAEAVASLPADTAAAIGFGLPDGWGEELWAQLEQGFGPVSQELTGMPFADLVEMAEQQSGLALPEDLETLLGDSFAVAVGGDFSVEAAGASPDGSDVPVGAKVVGDAEEVQRVLDALDAAFGIGTVVGDDAQGDTVAVGPSADYRAQLLEDGDLADAEAFDDVVAEAEDAYGIVYVDLDAGWISELVEMEGDDEVARNLEPLRAFGLSTWVEDETSHASLRLTTD